MIPKSLQLVAGKTAQEFNRRKDRRGAFWEDRYHATAEFAKKLIRDAKVSASPGIGFGEYGDDYVRFGLIENEHRTRQAVRSIRDMLRKDGILSPDGAVASA